MEENRIKITNKPYTKDSKGFYIMPNELHYLLNEMGCNAYDKLIYEAMVRYSNNSENNPFPSYQKLQEWASCSKGSVSKSIKHLQELGLLEVIHRGTRQGDSNVYRINYVYSITEATKIDSEVVRDKKVINTSFNNKKQIQGNMEGLKIPFKRGTHPDIMTSKESEELQKLTADFVDKDYSDFDRLLA